jgi:hypothetical protein
MPPEAKYNTSHHAGTTPAQRLAARLRNSGGRGAETAHFGTGPLRSFHNVHPSGGQGRHHDAHDHLEPSGPLEHDQGGE